ncbi:xanthine dehydrogenase family protein molybdopterin-binding subunit [Membranihabitans maritimus]|uniref:xanthine dehydrogenase family protein molybdopterin-binding subunit n=1 Tax=Membranihabitans maritimus TaxID=2904244 RepID=UPI001F2AF122|nr:molybdopterin cofactor-binding domain-containing protein [Membranihabitans maritimus]
MNNPNSNSRISRRSFLGRAAGFTFILATGVVVPNIGDKNNDQKKGKELSIWVHLAPDGRVRIYNPSAEMGQGSMTACAVLIAEEMNVDWKDVIIESSPVDPENYGLQWGGQLGGPMMTVGSRTVRGYFNALREAGARANYVLRYSASRIWGVPTGRVSTEMSKAIHSDSGKTITFGELSGKIALPTNLDNIKVPLKDNEDFTLIGKDIPRYDIPGKVTGEAQYAMDIFLPEMLYGVMQRAPVNKGRPVLNNKEEVLKGHGVVDVLVMDYGVGVVADSTETALKAKARLDISWSDAESSDYDSILAYQEYERLAKSDQKGRSISSKGNVLRAFETATEAMVCEYKNDFAYHAQMEPLNAVISVSPDGKRAEAWVGSQSPDNARRTIANVLGIDFYDVNYHVCYLGGGFGRRSMSDYVEEATILANHIRKPLKFIWTREDDVGYGAFRPISLQRMEAAIGGNGNIMGWKHIIAGTGGGLLASGAEISYYDIPTQLIEVRSIDHGVRTKHWRSVGHGPNKFAIESFLDEIAYAQKEDPYLLRRKLMHKSPRELAVLDKVAEMADWGNNSSNGRAKGIAFAERSGALTAAVGEISLDSSTGRIKVHRFWVVMDAGLVVQPNNAIAQLEGGINFGLSNVLHESITFKSGQVQQSNFHDYRLLRISEAPESIECFIMPSAEEPAGVGEASTPIVGGAIANAFLKLTGKPLRHMPFTAEKVKEVLDQSM